MSTVLARAGTLAAAAVLGTCLAVAAPADAATTARHFANCTAMHRVYPHGVGKPGAHDKVKGHTRPVTTFKRSTALYNANRKSDRDHDNIACEKL